MPQTKNRRRDSKILANRAAQVQRGAARAAVLGVNDGLVSVLCLILGVAGAHGKPSAVLLAGFAGLIAGAVSMAAGEWISVKSQVDLFNGVLKDVRTMMKRDHQFLLDQLRLKYKAGGFSGTTASIAAGEIAAHDKKLYREVAIHVVGVNPDELGSPWTAALSSFMLFTVGALTALAPWFFVGGAVAITLSIVLTAIGGLIVGGYVSKSSGDNITLGALRQLFIIIVASIVTYGVGYLFGTVTGI